jgi:murein DD-endopeptidase MepM/ murein hydrolase activator NlpD
LELECLEDRTLLAATLTIINAFPVASDGTTNEINSTAVGELVYVHVDYRAQGVPAGASYQVDFTLDGTTFSRSLTLGEGQPGSNLEEPDTRSTASDTRAGFWALGAGKHTLTVVLNSTNTLAETPDSDNTRTTTFTTTDRFGADVGAKFVSPIAGVPYQDWSITNYVDLNRPDLAPKDYQGGDYTYKTAAGYTHAGIDIALPDFAAMDRAVKVYAAADGVVEYVHDGEFDRDTDINSATPANFVEIRHSNGWETLYLHLRTGSIDVAVGQHVHAGDLLGLVGSSGDSTGAHLHFEVHHNNDVVETYMAPNSYWASPWAYSGEMPGVLDHGVTNYDPLGDLDGSEQPPATHTFNQSSGQKAFFWFVPHGILPSDSLVVYLYKPDGTLAGSNQVKSDHGEVRFGSYALPVDLPGVPDPGTWRMVLQRNGSDLASDTFEVTAAGAPGIRVDKKFIFNGAVLTLSVSNGRTTPIDFGSVAHGDTPPRQDFVVTNYGTAPLTPGAITPPPGFTLVSGLPASLDPGATAVFTVQLDSDTPGSPHGLITIASGNPGVPDYRFAVKGLVLPDPGLPVVITGDKGPNRITLLPDFDHTGVAWAIVQSFRSSSHSLDDLVSTAAYNVDLTNGLVVNSGNGDDLIDLSALKFVFFPGQVTVRCGDGNDTVNVESSSTGSNTVIDLGNGDDTVNLSPTTQDLSNVAGDVTVNGGTGSDTLNVYDQQDSSALFYDIGDTTLRHHATFVDLGPAVNYHNIASLIVNTANSGSSLIAVDAAAGPPLTVNTNGDGNTVSLKASGSPVIVNCTGNHNSIVIGAAYHDLSLIGTPVTINGGGSDSVEVRDDANNQAELYNLLVKLDGTGLLNDRFGPQIGFSGITSLDLWTSNGVTSNPLDPSLQGAHVAVESTLPGTTTTIHGGQGDLTLEVGAYAHDLSLIKGNVTLVGGQGNNTLTIEDQYNPRGENYTLTKGEVEQVSAGGRVSGASLGFYSLPLPLLIDFSAMPLTSLTIFGAAGGNIFRVADTPSGLTTALHTGAAGDEVDVQGTTGPLAIAGGGGPDLVTIGSRAPLLGGTLAGINGPVSVANTAGLTDLIVDDSGDGGSHPNVTLGAGSLQGLAAEIDFPAGGLHSLNIWDGSGGNTYTVTGTGPGYTTTLHTQIADHVSLADGGNPLAYQGPLVIAGNGTGPVPLSVDDSLDSALPTITLDSVTLPDGLYGRIRGLGLVPILYRYADTSGVTFQTGTGGAVVNVLATVVPVSLIGHSSNTTVNVGTAGRVQSIAGTVSVSNSGGATTLNVNDAADTAARTVTVTSGALTGLAPAAIDYDPSSLIALNVHTGASADFSSITVIDTPAGGALPATTTLTVGTSVGGNNCGVYVLGTTGPLFVKRRSLPASPQVLVTAGIAPPFSDGTLDNIKGPITFSDTAPKTYLLVYDGGNTGPRAERISDRSILFSDSSGLHDQATITYQAAGMVGVVVQGGSGADTFTVVSTAAGPPGFNTDLRLGPGTNTVNARKTTGTLQIRNVGGTDTVTVGNPTPRGLLSLAGIHGNVLLEGDLSHTTLVANNSGDSNNHDGSPGHPALNLYADALNGFDLTNYYTSIEVIDATTPLSAFTIYEGSGIDTFTVQGTVPGTTTTLYADRGTDSIYVRRYDASGNASAKYVVSPMAIYGRPDLTTVTLDDSGVGPADRVTLTTSQVGAAPGDNFFGPGGSLTFSGISAMTVNTANSATGSTIDLTPSATTAFAINGGPAVNSTLVLDLAGVTIPQDFPGSIPGSGYFTFGNRKTVTYSGILFTPVD